MSWPSVASLAPWPVTSIMASRSSISPVYFSTTTGAGRSVRVEALRRNGRFTSAVRAVAACCWACGEKELPIWPSSRVTSAADLLVST